MSKEFVSFPNSREKMSNVTAGVLNPFTPLAFLEPTIASQYEVSRYLFAITLGAYGWDICINVVNDYRLLTQGSLRYATAVYFLSRIFTLGYIMSSFVFQVANVPHCQTLQIVLGIFNVLSQTFTSLLFLFRVVAVYRNQQYVKSFFVILWLCVVGGSLSVPLGIAGAHIGPTMACINTVVKKTTELSMIMPMVNDTAVFAAITYRILDYSVYESGGYAKIRAFFGWQKLVPTVSRNLLQGGQHYYFFALLTNIVTLVLNQLPLPPTYRGMFTIASLALINALACIVYRRIRFGFIAEDGTTMTTVKGPNTYGLPLVHFRPQAGASGLRTDVFDTVAGSQSNGVPLEIRVVQHKEEFHHGKA